MKNQSCAAVVRPFVAGGMNERATHSRPRLNCHSTRPAFVRKWLRETRIGNCIFFGIATSECLTQRGRGFCGLCIKDHKRGGGNVQSQAPRFQQRGISFCAKCDPVSHHLQYVQWQTCTLTIQCGGNGRTEEGRSLDPCLQIEFQLEGRKDPLNNAKKLDRTDG